MMTPDEETPLLAEEQRQTKPSPIPWSQVLLLLILQLAEPLTAQVISPFAPEVRPSLSADASYDVG